jgi:hypothetical protein
MTANDGGMWPKEGPMPGNPKECREHAKRCLQLAQETKNPVLKESLTDIAGQWTRLATDLEVTTLLLDEMGMPQPQTGCISSADSNGFGRLAETLGAAPALSKEGNTPEGQGPLPTA